MAINFKGFPLTFKRIILYIVGLFVMAFGIAFAVFSHWGVSPVTSMPYAISRALQTSLGNATIIAYVIMLIAQVFILRKDMKVYEILQIPAAIMFGKFCDANKWILANALNIPELPVGYWDMIPMRILYMVVGVIFVALGLCGYMPTKIMPIPPDALAAVIGVKIGKNIGQVKRVLDFVWVVIALIISLVVMHDYENLWIGTIIAAFGVGTVYQFWQKLILKPINIWLYGSHPPVPVTEKKKEEAAK